MQLYLQCFALTLLVFASHSRASVDECQVSNGSTGHSLLQSKHLHFNEGTLSTSKAFPMLLPLSKYMPNRTQWFANYGYCGETSFIQSGLLYGQYLSQYDVRRLVSGNQSSQSSQLLPGVNDAKAARILHMSYQRLQETDPQSFTQWMQNHTQLGHPVVTGFLTNFGPDFFGPIEPDLVPGQAEYDHVITVIDVKGPLGPTGDYSITFYDHGLWSGNPNLPAAAAPQERYPTGTFTYLLSNFVRTRQQANQALAAYSMVDSSQNKYGIALTGPVPAVATNGCPVYMTTMPAEELPVMQEHSEQRPPSSILTLTVTAYGLQAGNYTVYRYPSWPRADALNPTAGSVQSYPFTVGNGQTTFTLQPILISSSDMVIMKCYKS